MGTSTTNGVPAAARRPWLVLPIALIALAWWIRPSPARSPRGNRPKVVLVMLGPVKVPDFEALLHDPALPTIRRLRNFGGAAHLWSLSLRPAADLLGRGRPKASGLRGWVAAVEAAGWRVRRPRLTGAAPGDALAPALADADTVVLDVALGAGEDTLTALRRVEAWLTDGLPRSTQGLCLVLLLYGRFASAADVGAAVLWGESFRPMLEDEALRADACVRLLYYIAGLEKEAPAGGPAPLGCVASRFLLHHETRGGRR